MKKINPTWKGKEYSPRLESRDARVRKHFTVPIEVAFMIEESSRITKKTESWVIEKIIENWAGLDIVFKEKKIRIINANNGNRRSKSPIYNAKRRTRT